MSSPEQPPPEWAALGHSAESLKACCAAIYQTDAVLLILGDSFHPGGLALTRHLAGALGLRPGQRVADIASGPGTTAFLLAAEFGVDVDGIDLGAATVAAANAKAIDAGVNEQIVFHVGDAERLPLAEDAVDAVICECAMCIFPDKMTAAAEMARVLKPGGRVGITDVTLDRDRLDTELASIAGWVACVADARPITQYCGYLQQAGLEVALTEPHDEALAQMIDTIDTRLTAYGMLGAPALAGVDIDSVRRKVAIAARAVIDGIAGYSLLIASKPAR
jgi:SAM-dependent methyltransferase